MGVEVGLRIQIPIFYKLLISMLFIATLPIILLGIVTMGGTKSIISSIGLENSILILTLVTVGVVMMWSFFLANRITDPIVRLSSLATEMSRGEMKNTEIPIMTNDEIGELVSAFNKMVNTYRILDSLAKEEAGK